MNRNFNFIGRQNELQVIENFVYKSKTPILYLYGNRGVGKTALVFQFLERNKKQIKDNYYYLNGNNLESELLNIISPDKNLIIIDDFELYLTDNLHFLKELSDKNSQKRIILISYRKPLLLNQEIDISGRISYLQINGLPVNDLNKLIEERIPNLVNNKSVDIKRLYDYFENNPKQILTSLNYLSDNPITSNELIDFIDKPFKQSGIVDMYGNPISKESAKFQLIENKILVINDSLVEKAYRDPDFIFKINPHKFEELVAELLEREGFNVNITKKTRDGGKDIFIAQNNRLGNFLYYIECKQFAPNNHVGVKLVRELFGTISADRATAGLLVTTSYFSKEATDFVENVRNQLSLKDYYDLKKWIDDVYLKKNICT